MRNKVGIYYAFWEQEWVADYLQYIQKASRLGFDVLELAAGCLPDMTHKQRKTIAQTAEDAGIELTYCIGLPSDYDMASADKTVRQNGVEYVKHLLRCVNEMDGKILGGIIYSSWPAVIDFPVAEKSVRWNRSVECVREVAETARDEGILYCLEIVNRYEQYLLNTAEEGRRFVDEVGAENVKLLLDAFHMNIEEDSMYDAILQSAGYIGHFHIGETNRRVPGRGRMPWDEILDGLRDIKYTGHIVMEPFLKLGGQVGQDIRVWRDLSNNGDEAFMDAEAAYALGFMHNKLAERS